MIQQQENSKTAPDIRQSPDKHASEEIAPPSFLQMPQAI
jgi:hypothetical protein